MSANVQHVALASRIGAEEASQTACLPGKGQVPENIVEAVERHLNSAGFSCSKVILEHNAGGRPAVLVWGHGPGRPPQSPLPWPGTYVRVSVFARTGQFTPNLLGLFGLDLSSGVLDQATTYRYQLPAGEKRK